VPRAVPCPGKEPSHTSETAGSGPGRSPWSDPEAKTSRESARKAAADSTLPLPLENRPSAATLASADGDVLEGIVPRFGDGRLYARRRSRVAGDRVA